jgi:hypothetical protein
MAGSMPGHDGREAASGAPQGVDGRVEPGHDGREAASGFVAAAVKNLAIVGKPRQSVAVDNAD